MSVYYPFIMANPTYTYCGISSKPSDLPELNKHQKRQKGGSVAPQYRPDFQTFCNQGIEPKDSKRSRPERTDTFELCVIRCDQLGEEDCSGWSFELDSNICHLHSGELLKPYSRQGWNAAERKGQYQATEPQTTIQPGSQPGAHPRPSISSNEEAKNTATNQPSTSSIVSTTSSANVSINRTASVASTSFLTSTTSLLNISNITTPTLLSTSTIAQDSDFSDMMSHHGGQIAGMLVGSVAGLALFAGLIFLFRRHRKKKREQDWQFNLLSMKKVETTAYSDQVPRRRPGEYAPITAATLAALRHSGTQSPKELMGSTRMPVELPADKSKSESKSKSTRPKAQHTAMFDIVF